MSERAQEIKQQRIDGAPDSGWVVTAGEDPNALAINQQDGRRMPPRFAGYLEPARDPKRAIEMLRMPHQPDIRLMWQGGGFDDLMAQMPVIDPKQVDQSAEVAATRSLMEILRLRVMDKIERGEIVIPPIPEGEMGRIILAVEEPKQGIDANGNATLLPGTEIVLAIWGKGYSSPVHGHAPGYVYEDAISGSFDVRMFRLTGDSYNRQAVYEKTVYQNGPGIFCSEFRQDVGQAPRTELIHNFRANVQSVSLHILPEHVRDGSGNEIRVVNTPESAPPPDYITRLDFQPGLNLRDEEVTRIPRADLLKGMQIGDVYLVRSTNVAFLGDHFVVISGGLIEKPHGRRPQDITVQVPLGEQTPLDAITGRDDVVALKLSDTARTRFFNLYGFPEEFVGYDQGREELLNRIEKADIYEGTREILTERLEGEMQAKAYGPLNALYAKHAAMGTPPTAEVQRLALEVARTASSEVINDVGAELGLLEIHKKAKELKLSMLATIEGADGLDVEVREALKEELNRQVVLKKRELEEQIGSYSEATIEQQTHGTAEIYDLLVRLNSDLAIGLERARLKSN